MKLSVVLPAFNEADTIYEVLTAVASGFASVDGLSDYEILVVDDASTDDTVKQVEAYQQRDEAVRLLSCQQNAGKGAAVRWGFQEASGDILLVQDADLEYSPRDYPSIIQPIIDGAADVVYGSRFKGETTRVLFFWHYLGNKFLTLLSNMFTNLNMTDMETGYKVFRRVVVQDLRLVSQRFGIEPELTAKVAKIPGLRIYEVPISYFGRTYEEGKKIGWKDGVVAIGCVIRFNLFSSRRMAIRSATKNDGDPR
jgi:glycosyltransferase involved in cell wall biosynthesis